MWQCYLTDVFWQLPAECVWEGGGEEETHFHLSMLAWEQDPGNLERIVGLDRQEGDSGHVHFWLLTLISYFSLLSLSFLFVK